MRAPPRCSRSFGSPAWMLAISLAANSGITAEGELDSAELIDPSYCRTISADTERLRCYDQLANGQIPTSSPRGILSPKSTLPTQSGLSVASTEKPSVLTSQATSDAAAKPANPFLVRAVVTERSRNGARRVVIRLDDGSEWVETSANKFKKEIPIGASVTVSREGLGWFRLRLDGVSGVMAVQPTR